MNCMHSLLAALAVAGSAAPAVADMPLLTLRLACKEDRLGEIIETNLRHPGSCDEYWTGYQSPYYSDAKLARDIARMARMGRRSAEAGFRPGTQQGCTLGHGSALIGVDRNLAPEDRLRIPEDAYAVGRDGARLGDYCARSPFVLETEERYIERVCRDGKPSSIWLDDDLRIGIWKPDACFCGRCIAAFNAETGRSVTREELVGRLFGCGAVDAIRGEWFAFNARSLAGFAAAARRGADRANPDVFLALQTCSSAHFYSGLDRRPALWELSGHGRHPTGVRCGSGYYTEVLAPRDLVRRLQHVTREAERCRSYGDWVATVTYENDTYTHQVLNKTWEASMKEDALALAAGCDAVTMYWFDSSREEPMEYFDEFAAGCAAWRPYFERLSSVSRRTRMGGVARRVAAGFENVLPGALRRPADPAARSLAVSYSREHPCDLKLALYGIPVTVEEAQPQAFYEPSDVWSGTGHQNNPTTAELEAMRDMFDERSGGTVPVRLAKTHPLVVYPRVAADGSLVAATFFNCTLGRAAKVPVRLRRPGGSRFTWMSGAAKPVELKSEPGSLPGERVVVLPEIPGFDLGTVFVD